MNEVIYGGFWKRATSVIIDTLILWAPASLLRWNATFLGLSGTALDVIDFIYLTLVWGLYYGFMESSRYQATLGKQLMGLQVTTNQGERLTFLNAFSRFLAGYISVIPLGLGFFMIGWTKKKQGLHDILANSLVVKITNP